MGLSRATTWRRLTKTWSERSVISRTSFRGPWEEPNITPPQVLIAIIREIKTVSAAQL